jgi:nucleoid DNA-binding protein
VATTKIELAKAIYEKHGGISFREAKRIVDFILDTLRARLEEGDKVLLSGFGTFEVVERKARKGRNPRTGATLIIPARKSLTFQPSKLLTNAVNGVDE